MMGCIPVRNSINALRLTTNAAIIIVVNMCRKFSMRVIDSQSLFLTFAPRGNEFIRFATLVQRARVTWTVNMRPRYHTHDCSIPR